MSGSIRERQKKVRKQNEQARQQDKIFPFETYQSNEMGNFPFGGYSEDAQLRSNGTRQGRMYNLENRLPASGKSSVSEAREWIDNKKKNTRTRKVLENAFNRKK